MSIYSNTHPRVHDVQFEAAVPMSRNRVVLAYSGGLDTSVAIRWLQERDYDVVALALDVGQPGGLGGIKERAERLGATAYVVDARREFADEYILPALKANAVYEGQYPLSTALARPLIGKYLVAVARREGARFIAHGGTGKGNGQVPVALHGRRRDLGDIIPALNEVAGRHGVGRIDHMESRVVGIKSREVYECPAATVLIKAHQALEPPRL